MERRTNRELIEAVRDRLDMTATPYFDDVLIADALNNSYDRWLTQAAKEAEGAERDRRELAPLIVEATLTLKENKADLTALTPREFRILSVSMTFSDCNKNRPAKPLSFDAWRLAERDPWNAPDEYEPAYLDGADTLQLLPIPRSATVVYLARPKDILDSDDGQTEVEYGVQELLIEMAAARLAIPQDNGQAYQALTAEYTKTEN
jgi:hypothetical protein